VEDWEEAVRFVHAPRRTTTSVRCHQTPPTATTEVKLLGSASVQRMAEQCRAIMKEEEARALAYIHQKPGLEFRE